MHLSSFLILWEKIAFKYGIWYMLLGNNHPNNENMIDSKKYHIFYDKEVTTPTRFLKTFCII